MVGLYDLNFSITNGHVYISSVDGVKFDAHGGICEAQIAGENKDSHGGALVSLDFAVDKDYTFRISDI